MKAFKVAFLGRKRIPESRAAEAVRLAEDLGKAVVYL